MKQYYVAVGCPQSKLITLVDLLNVVAHETSKAPETDVGAPITIGIAASSRDALDELISGLRNVRSSASSFLCLAANRL